MTHTQESRREAHERIKPKINAKHRRILGLLKNYDQTSAELRDFIGGAVNSVRARLSELKNLGLILGVGRRKSQDTGLKITIWGLNRAMTPPPKKTTWKDRALEAMKELRLVKLELEAAELRLKKYRGAPCADCRGL